MCSLKKFVCIMYERILLKTVCVRMYVLKCVSECVCFEIMLGCILLKTVDANWWSRLAKYSR